MTGFEPWISGTVSDRSANCATTTAQHFLSYTEGRSIGDKLYFN